VANEHGEGVDWKGKLELGERMTYYIMSALPAHSVSFIIGVPFHPTSTSPSRAKMQCAPFRRYLLLPERSIRVDAGVSMSPPNSMTAKAWRHLYHADRLSAERWALASECIEMTLRCRAA
jgi:hypothetical protein